MSVAETNWAEIRRAYEAGPEAVTHLAERFSVPAGRIYRRAKKERWRRPAARPLQDSGAAGRPPEGLTESRRNRPVNKQMMIARLYKAIDQKLKKLEARMGSDRDISAADSERETRELGVMIRSFEKITEFATEIENRRQSSAPGRVSAADAERMRAEIAERLERLHAQGNTGSGSGEAKR